MTTKKLNEQVTELAMNYSDKEIATAFAKQLDALAEQAAADKNNATNATDAQSFYVAFQRRIKRAVFWWAAVRLADDNARGTLK